MTDTPNNSGHARRAELRQAYAERVKRAGIFHVRNTANGRVLLGSALDLRGPLNRVAFELDMKSTRHPELKRDLEKYPRGSFVIEVIEEVMPGDDPDFDPEKELDILERKRLAALDRSNAYNRDDKIRYP
jgi:hypothetical protein